MGPSESEAAAGPLGGLLSFAAGGQDGPAGPGQPTGPREARWESARLVCPSEMSLVAL